MGRVHSIRIPVHGFVEFNDWERDIINHRVFQRLRRIRQLASTEHLYPGATHTRFEHSLGVMHIATRMWDAIVARYQPILEEMLGYDPEDSNSRTLVRLAALLHDVGHAPFSHVSEELMPLKQSGQRFSHEEYSAELIKEEMRDVIDDHPANRARHNVPAVDIANFLRGSPKLGAERLFWRVLVVGQLDADRMDYLLRDSLHCGVEYGRFDLNRIIDTLALVANDVSTLHPDPQIAIANGGRHAAEGLIFARYFMFQQVYFHKVRKAYDYHIAECMRAMLSKNGQEGTLPDPSTAAGRRRFIELDDWSLCSYIKSSSCPKRHADAVLRHHHDRAIHVTPELAKKEDIEKHIWFLSELKAKGIEAWDSDADKEWYKVGKGEIKIATKGSGPMRAAIGDPLSEVSHIVRIIQETKQRMLFVPPDDYKRADELLKSLGKGT